MVAREDEQFHKFIWIITYLGEHITGAHTGAPLQICVLIMICLFSLEFMCRDTFFNSFKNRLILGVPSNNINICIKRYVKYSKSQFNITIVILRRFCYDYKCKIKFRGAKSFDRIFFNGRRTNIYDVFDCPDRVCYV